MGSLLGDSLEDFIEFGFGDFAVTVLVDCVDKSLDFLLGALPASIHLGKGSVDEVGNLIGVKGVAAVLVELAEHGINCISELLVAV